MSEEEPERTGIDHDSTTIRDLSARPQTVQGAWRGLIWSESGGIIRIEWVAQHWQKSCVWWLRSLQSKRLPSLCGADVLVQGGPGPLWQGQFKQEFGEGQST